MQVLNVPAKDDQLDRVTAFADEFLEALDCPLKTQMQIDLSIEEIFVNIAHYAYAGKEGDAEIRMAEADGVVTFTFIDSGVPYDPLKKPDPDVSLSAEDRQIGGLGIFMVKKSMDDMRYEYSNCRNILTLIKAI